MKVELLPLQEHDTPSDNGATCVGLHDRVLFSGHVDGSIWAWDVETAARLAVIQSVDQTINCLCAQHRLVAGFADGSARLWDLQNFELAGTLLGHNAAITSVFSTHESIFTSSKDNTVREWRRQDGEWKCLHLLAGHEAEVVAVCADDNVVVAAAADLSVKVWKRNSTVPNHVLTAIEGPICGLAIEDGHVIVTTEKSIHRFPEEAVVPSHTVRSAETIASSTVLANGLFLSLTAGSGALAVVDILAEKELSASNLGSSGMKESMVFQHLVVLLQPEGKLMSSLLMVDGVKPQFGPIPAAFKRARRLSAFELEQKEKESQQHQPKGATHAKIEKTNQSDHARQLPNSFSLSSGGKLTQELLSSVEMVEDPDPSSSITVLAVAEDPAVVLVFAGTESGDVLEYDVNAGTITRTLSAHSKPVRSLFAFGSELVSGSADCKVCVWPSHGNQWDKSYTAHTDGVSSVCMSDLLVISGSYDGTVCVFDRKTSQGKHQLTGHEGGITALLIAGSDRIVSGSEDKTVKVWDSEMGVCVATIEFHARAISSLRFLNGIVYSGGHDAAAAAWDISTGRQLQNFKNVSAGIACMCSYAENLIIGCNDGQVHVLDVGTGTIASSYSFHNSNSIVELQTCGVVALSLAKDGSTACFDWQSGEVLLPSLSTQVRRVAHIALHDSCAFLASDLGKVYRFSWKIALQGNKAAGVQDMLTKVDSILADLPDCEGMAKKCKELYQGLDEKSQAGMHKYAKLKAAQAGFRKSESMKMARRRATTIASSSTVSSVSNLPGLPNATYQPVTSKSSVSRFLNRTQSRSKANDEDPQKEQVTLDDINTEDDFMPPRRKGLEAGGPGTRSAIDFLAELQKDRALPKRTLMRLELYANDRKTRVDSTEERIRLWRTHKANTEKDKNGNALAKRRENHLLKLVMDRKLKQADDAASRSSKISQSRQGKADLLKRVMQQGENSNGSATNTSQTTPRNRLLQLLGRSPAQQIPNTPQQPPAESDVNVDMNAEEEAKVKGALLGAVMRRRARKAAEAEAGPAAAEGTEPSEKKEGGAADQAASSSAGDEEVAVDMNAEEEAKVKGALLGAVMRRRARKAAEAEAGPAAAEGTEPSENKEDDMNARNSTKNSASEPES